MVEFHFYSDIDFVPCSKSIRDIALPMQGMDYDSTLHFFNKVSEGLKTGKLINDYSVHTLQMSFLTQAWDLHFEYGARVFIHDHTGTYEVLEDDRCERTDRYLRRAHNLFKLWRAGEFWSISLKSHAFRR